MPIRPTRPFWNLVIPIALLGACIGRAGADDAPAAADHLLVARLGTLMREAEARHAIAFRPFTVPRAIIGVALIPAFHGDDVRANRGIAFEYIDDAGHRFVLNQWPSNGGSLDDFDQIEPAEAECVDTHTFRRGTPPSGIVWSTPHGLIMTLQSDGASDAQTVRREWKKLIRRGACR